MEGMRDNLMCPIHLDLLENAKTLPCQHVVCEECIGLWVAKKGELICPSCKQSHDLPAGGVSSLPTNFMINGLVDDFKKMGKEEKKGHGRKKSDSERETGHKGGKSSPQKPKVDPTTSFMEKKTKVYEDICSSTVILHVQLCNSTGKPIHEFAKILANVTTPKQKTVGASVSYQKKDGIFVVSFVPKLCGVHRVQAMIGKHHVKGSPMMVVVHPEGRYLAGIRGPLKSPRNILVVGYSLYITDTSCGPFVCTDWLGRSKIQVSSPQGKDINDMSPYGIIEANDKIFVTDRVNNCVYTYSNGSCISSFGKTHLNEPMGIAVNSNMMFYVSNKGSNEITVFGPDFSKWKSIVIEGGRKSLAVPSLACLALNQAEDHIIVADQGNCCLKLISLSETKVVNTITTKFGQAQAKPCGVAVDKDDNIYVTVVFKSVEQKRHMGPKGRHNFKLPSLAEGYSSHGGEERGAVLMYNGEGYFLGRFGDNELLNPGGICIVEEPSLAAFVVDMGSSGYGSKGPGIKIFSI